MTQKVTKNAKTKKKKLRTRSFCDAKTWKNLVFANDLKEIADDVIMYPRYHSENYSELKSLFLNYDLILGRIVGPKDLPEFGNFQQHRIII